MIVYWEKNFYQIIVWFRLWKSVLMGGSEIDIVFSRKFGSFITSSMVDANFLTVINNKLTTNL